MDLIEIKKKKGSISSFSQCMMMNYYTTFDIRDGRECGCLEIDRIDPNRYIKLSVLVTCPFHIGKWQF
jgi:hypothetical protein